MNEKVYLSIVVPTLNRLYSLKKYLLPSLEKQDLSECEVLLVDDGSTDGTADYFKKSKSYSKLSLRILRHEKNLGLPAARNHGMEHSKGNWILFLEDDILIKDNNFIEKSLVILKKYDVDKEVAVISANRISERGRGVALEKNEISRIGKITGEIYLDEGQKDHVGFVETTQSCSFIRKSVFPRVKYDEKHIKGNFFREESDFFFSIRESGFKILFYGKDLSMIHMDASSAKGGCRMDTKARMKKEMYYIKNHYWFLKKHFNFVYLRLFFYVIYRTLVQAYSLLFDRRSNKIRQLFADFRF